MLNPEEQDENEPENTLLSVCDVVMLLSLFGWGGQAGGYADFSVVGLMLVCFTDTGASVD